MAAMWHCLVVEGHIEPVFADVALAHDGAVTICQDLTIFNVTAAAVTARQAQISPVAPTVVGPSATPRALGTPLPPPGWWKDAALDWRRD